MKERVYRDEAPSTSRKLWVCYGEWDRGLCGEGLGQSGRGYPLHRVGAKNAPYLL
jgi:hypothetical protein